MCGALKAPTQAVILIIFIRVFFIQSKSIKALICIALKR